MVSMRAVLFLMPIVGGLAIAGTASAAPKDGAVLDRVACGTVETTVRFGDIEESLGVPDRLDDRAGRSPADGCAPDEALRTEIDAESASGTNSLIDVHRLMSGSAPLSPEQVERLQALLNSVREVLGVDHLLDLFESDEEAEILVDLQEASEEALDSSLDVEERTPEEMAVLEAELIARALAEVYRFPDAATGPGTASPHYSPAGSMSSLNILSDSGTSTTGATATVVRNKSLLEYLLGLFALIPNKISLVLFVGTLILLRLLMVLVNRHSHR